jgi:hypothetical protein
MAQFSLRRLLASTTVIAIGYYRSGARNQMIALKGYIYFGSGALIGMGIFNLFKKPLWGVCLGMLLALFALIGFAN